MQKKLESASGVSFKAAPADPFVLRDVESEKPMSREEAIKIIQKNERGRQGRIYMKYLAKEAAKSVHKKFPLSLHCVSA